MLKCLCVKYVIRFPEKGTRHCVSCWCYGPLVRTGVWSTCVNKSILLAELVIWRHSVHRYDYKRAPALNVIRFDFSEGARTGKNGNATQHLVHFSGNLVAYVTQRYCSMPLTSKALGSRTSKRSYRCSISQVQLKPGKHQADIKELSATKADSVVASRRLWLATKGECQLACALCACL